MTGTLSQTALGTFPIFYFLDVLLETCSLFFYVTLFILFLVSYIYIFFFILTLDLCRASLKTTLCDVGSLLKDLIYYYYYYYRILIYQTWPIIKSKTYLFFRISFPLIVVFILPLCQCAQACLTLKISPILFQTFILLIRGRYRRFRDRGMKKLWHMNDKDK